MSEESITVTLHQERVEDSEKEERNSVDNVTVDSSNETQETVNTAIGSETDIDDGYLFRMTLPEDGLALKSVSVQDGILNISFTASPNVFTITEEDFAVVCRLVSEGKRPEFYFYGFPKGHPFAGRQYNSYRPTWLRGTSVGKLLFKADWKMKCLHVGARTNESGTTFYSWKSSSNLQGLATWPDFPKDAKPIGRSIIMSCESVQVHREDDSLEFVEDPIVTITDQSNSLYSKYISEIFPNIAYHDEPLFLKMQELSKLILVCEWLINEKGVKFSQKWMSEHTTRSKENSALQAATPSSYTSNKPPYDMIPKLTTVWKPTDDVTVMTWEAEQYRCLTKSGVKYCYGFCDGGELVLFTEDGKPLHKEKFIRSVVELSTSLGNKKLDNKKVMLNVPPSLVHAVTLFLAASADLDGESDEQIYMPGNYTEEIMTPFGPMTLCVETDDIPTINGSRIERTTTLYPQPPLISEPIKETMLVKTSFTNYDMLYGNIIPPNTPIGLDVTPDVETWSELYEESVPWPQSFQIPYTGVGEPAPSGGVSTRNLTEVRTTSVQRESNRMGSRSGWVDQYRRNGQRLDVQPMRSMQTGTIRLLGVYSREYSTVAYKFASDWKTEKGACPSVHSIFAVTNNELKRKWSTYQMQLSNQTVEQYYHGTSLTCNITTTQILCPYASCGVCGISSCGLDPKFIRQNIMFQRFGSGFYLAPHSSKCHDYTEGSNGCRAMLLCDVLPGKKHHLTKTDQSLRGPPPGCNSVFGQVGRDLNYPEIVLYESNAVLARYIIVYQKDGVSHPLSS